MNNYCYGILHTLLKHRFSYIKGMVNKIELTQAYIFNKNNGAIEASKAFAFHNTLYLHFLSMYIIRNPPLK